MKPRLEGRSCEDSSAIHEEAKKGGPESLQAGSAAAVSRWLSRVLRMGVVSSFVLVLLGIVVSFVEHPDYLHSTEALEAILRTAALTSRPVVHPDLGLERVLASPGRWLTNLGIIVLILTPVFRVATSLLLFGLSRDRLYVLLTSIVLLLMACAGVVGGLAG